MQIFFSVVLPAYNTPPNILKRAINSVLNQTYPYFELIIVDDGSTPSLEPIIKGYNDERIIFIRHEENKGAGAAHNAGIKAAKYDWIAFICHDDEWVIDKLETCKEYILKNKNFYFFYSDEYFEENDKLRINKASSIKVSENFSDYENALLTIFMKTSSIIVHKTVFENVGYYEESGILIDWDFYIRVFKNYQPFYIEKPLIIYHYSSLGITHPKRIFRDKKAGSDFKSFLLKWEKEMLKSKIPKKLFSIRWNAIAQYYLEIDDFKTAIFFYKKGIKFYPFWRGNYIDFIKLIVQIFLKSKNTKK